MKQNLVPCRFNFDPYPWRLNSGKGGGNTWLRHHLLSRLGKETPSRFALGDSTTWFRHGSLLKITSLLANGTLSCPPYQHGMMRSSAMPTSSPMLTATYRDNPSCKYVRKNATAGCATGKTKTTASSDQLPCFLLDPGSAYLRHLLAAIRPKGWMGTTRLSGETLAGLAISCNHRCPVGKMDGPGKRIKPV